MAGRTLSENTALPQTLRRPPGGEGPALVVRDLSKRFGGIHAVDGVSFTVRDRTLHALIGPNGAGKTTAFNLVSGLYMPDGGTIELEGRSIAGLRPEDITAAGVGRSFQITNLFSALTIEENLAPRRCRRATATASPSGEASIHSQTSRPKRPS